MNVERGEIVHGFEIPMFFGPVGILPREHSNGDVSLSCAVRKQFQQFSRVSIPSLRRNTGVFVVESLVAGISAM